jgi:acyl-CoA reductase-like NAD-dependent aldehyde dehydrogenase
MTQTIAKSNVKELIQAQRQFFATGQTKELAFRLEQLQRLKKTIQDYEQKILDALKADLNKPELEGMLEVAVIQDINYILKHLKSWVKPQKVKTPLDQFPASAKIYAEPLGVVLIIGPWNYPFSLMIAPLLGAIAAGNCAILKPSELAPNTSAIVTEVIRKTFDPNYIAVIEGGVETSQQLLAEKFDHIFFTGGTKIGQIVMEAAAKHLTPVTLELGGKSPCIVEPDIDVKVAAKRITWGKFINGGQTCIAPDYLLVNQEIKSQLITEIKQCIADFYGGDPANSPDYPRIISDRHFHRLTSFLSEGEILIGGQTNPENRYIAPTLIDGISPDAAIMEDEIFGPILPILAYRDLSEAIALINSRPKPLALYLFSQDKTKQQQVLTNTSSGGVCINDTIVHIASPDLPFGGVGDSGIGSYHGKASFDTFSHQKSVLSKSFMFDFDWRYAPYTPDKLKLLKKLFLG